MVRIWAYQYRDLFDLDYDGDECQKFKKFVNNRLGLDLDRELAEGLNKVIRFSYPDLEYYRVPPHLLDSLKQHFRSNFSGGTLEEIYVVYVRERAPQIGFTASVAFEINLDDRNADELKRRFRREDSQASTFHKAFKAVWESQADKRQTLPVVVFIDEIHSLRLFGPKPDFDDRIFGPPEKVGLPSGRSVLLERGFPYVSYVLHADNRTAIPEKIHRSDFAILMALPGFVESKLESIRRYRDKLKEVQNRLEADDFSDAETKYNEAWRDFEGIQGLVPTTTAAVQRIQQKYPGRKSLFAVIASDNAELIQYTVSAAIEATKQVRANIQSFAQQRLQRSVNRLQTLTTVLTGILAAGAVITILLALYKTPSTNTRIVGINEPVRVISEPIPDRLPRALPALRSIAIPAPHSFPSEEDISLVFKKGIHELPITVSTPMMGTGRTRIESLLLTQDGVLLAQGTVASDQVPAGIRLLLAKEFFTPGRKYYVQLQQGDLWRIKVPITVRFTK